MNASSPLCLLEPAATQARIDQQNLILIDVRNPDEYATSHAKSARNLPLPTLQPEALAHELPQGKATPIAVICQAGSRSRKAADALVAAGYTQVVDVAGGTSAWQQQGQPMVRNRRVLPLIQQVHITVGTLILAFVALGGLVHVGFFYAIAFMGAGLLIAGTTGFCGMGFVLQRMPWNRAGQTACSIASAPASAASQSTKSSQA